jgi:Fur family iron response transcriptional regulator
MISPQQVSEENVVGWLRNSGIIPTSQRVGIARLFYGRCLHLSAEEVFRLANADQQPLSKATVYNTLALFVEKGLIRQVMADPARVFYDSNVVPHHHFFDVESGELTDIDPSSLQVSGVPALPEGKALEGVDVVIRIRQSP